MLRWLAERSGIHYWGRAPLNLLVPKVLSHRLTAKPGSLNRGRVTVLLHALTDVKILMEGEKHQGVYPFVSL